MKKIIFVAIALFCGYATNFAQSKAPIAVLTAFNQKFPNASKVKWDKENAHEYEANFAWNNSKYSANYTETGEWLETESHTTFSALPEMVKKAFTENHKNAKVKAVAKIEMAKGITKYEIEVKKGLKTIEYFYSETGTEMKD
jgi:Putative beta-lactamase-inhibitor-like, PepSY-like